MRRIGKFAHAAKVVSLCLPPVIMSLIGLAAMSRKKPGATAVAGNQSAAVRPAAQRNDSA